MEISKQGAEFIAQFEGCKDKAYRDSGGTWTIGFGTTRYPDGSRVKEGDTCTYEQALAWFRHDLKSFGLEVERLVKRHLVQMNLTHLFRSGTTPARLTNLADSGACTTFGNWPPTKQLPLNIGRSWP